MFENLLGQSVSARLIQDIETGVLAPAMLFSGPPASGKGTGALELGRVVSCEAPPAETGPSVMAPWNCGCSACARHRLIIHPDLLCLGWRPFSAEIAASAGAFLRNPKSASSRLLFVRSLRKLLSRFNPVLWEDEPRGKNFSALVYSLEEELDELEVLTPALLNSVERAADETEKPDSLTKLVEGMIKDAFKLESEGLSETVPIGQIRRAAWWSRLAPIGREKLIIIENSDRMQDGAQNSLLKLLEEPPGHSRFVLCTPRPNSLPRTILSRLRHYRFNSRDAAVENEVIRRVFKAEAGENGISAYLDSFLPVSADTLRGLAAYFAASAAYKAALLAKRQGRPLPEELVLLGKSSAPLAEAAGFGRPKEDSGAVIALIFEKAEKFEARSLFSRFLVFLLEQVSSGRGQGASVAYNELWKQYTNWAETAAGLYNLRPAETLEKLFIDLSSGMAKL